MYITGADGKRIYTLKKVMSGQVTESAHPARFSPDDKYSRYDTILLYNEVSDTNILGLVTALPSRSALAYSRHRLAKSRRSSHRHISLQYDYEQGV